MRSGAGSPAGRFRRAADPTVGAMIEVENLTKRYGDKIAVDDLSASPSSPGIVTGFLGPNGAGKSTTMRMIARPGPARPRAR